LRIVWASGPDSYGVAKVKASANVGEVKIVDSITSGQYAPPPGQKTKLKGSVSFSPNDSHDCAGDSDRIESTNFTNVGDLIVKRE
jgi:hypothetical protein